MDTSSIYKNREGWYCLEENHVRGDEQMPSADGTTPYYEYSSVRQPAQPFIPPQPPPPKQSRNRGLILILAVGSVVLMLGLVFLSGLPQALFHQSTTTLTPVAALPTHAPTLQATPTTNFRPASCPFPLGRGMVEGQMVKCGYVTVPESRSNPSGAT